MASRLFVSRLTAGRMNTTTGSDTGSYLRSNDNKAKVRSNGEYDRMLGTIEWGVRPNVEYDRMLGTIERRV